MDKRKEKLAQRKVAAKQKEVENNPSYKYMNESQLDFPKLLRADVYNDHSAVDTRLEKLYLELCIIEEQIALQQKINLELSTGVITMNTPDGRRLMTRSEMLTQARICEATTWQSKQNIEKELQDLMKFIGIPFAVGDGQMLTEEEHNDIAMAVITRIGKLGLGIFRSNKPTLIRKIKGE
jgi:hypothetical protein